MMIRRAYKTELDPNNEQRAFLLNHAGAARFSWNWALERAEKYFKSTGKPLPLAALDREFNALKKAELPWMYEVSKCVHQQALRHLDRAFWNFVAKRAGYPKFKSKKNGVGSFKLVGSFGVEFSRVKLPKLGWLRVKEGGYLPVSGARVTSASISGRAGRWFVSIQVEEEIAVPENQGSAIGIDLGLKTFAVGSDGSEWAAPKPLKANLKRLQRLSRRHSRKAKGSANRRKETRRLSRLYFKIACQRKDFLHKLSTTLTKRHAEIVIEDLNVAGMVQNRKLARSVSDAGWYEFARQLEYKVAWYGSAIVRAGVFYPSTKTCSGCGAKQDLSLKERTYNCPTCGLSIDRDLNAARNLLSLSSAGSARIDACGDLPLGESLKQEPSLTNVN
jgi:putative transposase